jgi:hypothetical protein
LLSFQKKKGQASQLPHLLERLVAVSWLMTRWQ